MKRLIRILTILMILVAIPIVIFAFFPKMVDWASTQSWIQSLYLFLITAGAFALFTGMDLLNRVDVYKVYKQSNEQETFWSTDFAKNRLGFLRNSIGILLLMCVVLVFLIFSIMVLPKAPEGSWYLWTIKVLGMAIGVGVLFLLNAVLTIDSGKKVILGIDDSPVQKAQKRVLTWQDKLFQLRPTFMDAEVDLKEDFDGISELDNPAPPWFMWLFYSTVLFAVVYFVNFTWTRRGPNQEQEYQASMVQHASSKNAFTKKAGESVDENSVTVETDQAKLTEAADIFKSKCAACHGADGGGMQGSGPNLADDYWIHGNSIKDVFKTIKYGYLSAGMVAWDGQISPPKMKALSTYVLSLRGTKPSNPQPPKGDKMDPKEKL